MEQHHVLKTFCVKDKDFDKTSAVQSCKTYVINHLASRKCFRNDDKRESKCQCLVFLKEETNANIALAAARYMVQWAGITMKEKKARLHTWIEYSAATNQMILPLLGEEDDETLGSMMVCCNAVYNMLNVGRRLKAAAKKDPTKTHENTGKKGALKNWGKKFEETKHSLYLFFSELKDEGLPFATRIVRQKQD